MMLFAALFLAILLSSASINLENNNNNNNNNNKIFVIMINSISVLSDRWVIMKDCVQPCLRLKIFPTQAGLEPGTARSTGHQYTYLIYN